jgi:hypothetical protein
MINPLGLPFLRWAATVTEDYAGYGLPILLDEADWRAWGDQVVRTPELQEAEALPDPALYDEAAEWAADLYAVVEG